MSEPCSMEQRIAALEKDSERNQTTHKEFFARFEGIQTQQAVIDVKLTQISSQIAAVQAALGEMKEKPAKRWESVVSTVLQWAILALLAYVSIGGK